MLPAPTTIAISTPRSRTWAIWPATAWTRSGSVPYSSDPIRDSPESLSRTRLKRGSSTPRMLFPHAKAHEAADDHVLAGLGRKLGAQLLDRLVLVALGVDVGLVEQHMLFQPLAPATLGDPRADVLGLVCGLLLVDAQLGLPDLLGDVLLGDELGRGRRDVGGDGARKGHEVVVAGDEVGLAVDLDQRADPVVVVDVGLHGALGRNARPALGGGGLAPDPENLDGLLEVSLGLGQGGLAVHHPG